MIQAGDYTVQEKKKKSGQVKVYKKTKIKTPKICLNVLLIFSVNTVGTGLTIYSLFL